MLISQVLIGVRICQNAGNMKEVCIVAYLSGVQCRSHLPKRWNYEQGLLGGLSLRDPSQVAFAKTLEIRTRWLGMLISQVIIASRICHNAGNMNEVCIVAYLSGFWSGMIIYKIYSY